jgi:hypothetical protein
MADSQHPCPLFLRMPCPQMVVAPGSDMTQKSVRSNVPLVLLGIAYGAVLLASWSTDTLHLMMPGSLEEGLKGEHSTQHCRHSTQHSRAQHHTADAAGQQA